MAVGSGQAIVDKLVPLTNQEKAEFVLPPGVEEFGSYNYMPKPFRLAEEHEYIHHTGHYTPRFTEYRQVKDLPDVGFRAVRIYWYRAQGWAVRFPDRWHSRRPDEGEGYGIVYEDPIVYYKIGCDHKMDVVERGRDVPGKSRNEERLECSRCGDTYWIDFS